MYRLYRVRLSSNSSCLYRMDIYGAFEFYNAPGSEWCASAHKEWMGMRGFECIGVNVKFKV